VYYFDRILECWWRSYSYFVFRPCHFFVCIYWYAGFNGLLCL